MSSCARMEPSREIVYVCVSLAYTKCLIFHRDASNRRIFPEKLYSTNTQLQLRLVFSLDFKHSNCSSLGDCLNVPQLLISVCMLKIYSTIIVTIIKDKLTDGNFDAASRLREQNKSPDGLLDDALQGRSTRLQFTRRLCGRL